MTRLLQSYCVIDLVLLLIYFISKNNIIQDSSHAYTGCVLNHTPKEKKNQSRNPIIQGSRQSLFDNMISLFFYHVKRSTIPFF